MHIILVVAALALSSALASAAIAEDEAAAGEQLFNNSCRTCHSWKPGDNRLGPSLHGVVGRKAGTAEGFGYSSSMKNSGITWDEENLDKFITSPDSVVPGNNMKPFAGIHDAATRKKIIEFMKSKSG